MSSRATIALCTLALAFAAGCTDSEPSGPPEWKTTTPLPMPRINATAAAPGNGYVYIFNGYVDAATCNGGASDGRVFYARQNDDGTLGDWIAGTPGTGNFRRAMAGAATANGFIYVAGGAINAPSWDGHVWFGKPGAGGDVTWTVATSTTPEWIGSSPFVATYDGYLYVGGGLNVGASPNVSQRLYAAQLDATTGQPGAFTRLGDLPAATLNAQLVIAGGHAYLLPGSSDTFQVADVAADHTLGPWAAATSKLPATVEMPTVTAVNGKLVVVLGGTAVAVSTLGADGAPGAWTTHSTVPAPMASLYQGVYSDGYLYLLGNTHCDADPATASAVYYCPVP